MKKLLSAAIALVPLIVSAQSAVDVNSLSQTELRGTARFMSMGGAFTALGGDLSTLNQNPAGIGVYRRSEIGVTIDLSGRKITAETPSNSIGTTQTKFNCDNFGYVGTARLDGALRTFSWGVSYNRLASFDRRFTAYQNPSPSSLTDYIASFTNGANENDLVFGDGYNPYFDSNEDWLSILAYNSYMINPLNNTSTNQYRGLTGPGTVADSQSEVYESGYTDEYSIDFGGNVSDVVMWGIGFGITDVNVNRTTYYSESMSNAQVASASTGSLVTGDAGYTLGNYSTTSGNGFNLKLGLIFKPINEFRVGLAVHTPTWYHFNTAAYADVDYSYYNPAEYQNSTNPLKGYEYTEDAAYNYRITSPWKMMVGMAGVIGSRAIISADYEHQAYNQAKLSYQNGWGSYESDDYVNDDTKAYFKAADILRIGAELRVTPSFSLRAGYSYTSTTTKQDVLDGRTEVFTAGMNPAYTLHRGSNLVSVGFGYRYQAFYIDAAYVYRNRKSTYCAFTPYDGVMAPSADLSETTNSGIVSVGFKF